MGWNRGASMVGFALSVGLLLTGGENAEAGRSSRTRFLTADPGLTGGDAGLTDAAAGRVRLRNAGRRRENLQIRLVGLEPRTFYDVRLSSEELLATLETNRRGRARARIRTRDLDPVLASSMSGNTVSVRHAASGATVLEGDLPDRDGDAPRVREAGAVFESDGGIRAVMELRSDPAHGSERLSLEVTGLGLDGRYILFMANGDRVMDDVAVLEADDDDVECRREEVEGEVHEFCRGHVEWKWRVDTARGQRLPFGAKSLDDLAGRRFEIRNGDGRTLLVGEVPHLWDAGHDGNDRDEDGEHDGDHHDEHDGEHEGEHDGDHHDEGDGEHDGDGHDGDEGDGDGHDEDGHDEDGHDEDGHDGDGHDGDGHDGDEEGDGHDGNDEGDGEGEGEGEHDGEDGDHDGNDGRD